MSVSLLSYLASYPMRLEVPHWTEYFKNRLGEVVIDHTYLDKMNAGQLQDLQLETWKRLFREAKIQREGSFLEYFENRIRSLIGGPYREGAVEQMIITYSTDPNTYDYTTIITYKCRQVQRRLQKDVTWAPEIGEFLYVRRVKVELQLPSDSIIRQNPHFKNQTWDPSQEADAQPAYHSDTRTYNLLRISS